MPTRSPPPPLFLDSTNPSSTPLLTSPVEPAASRGRELHQRRGCERCSCTTMARIRTQDPHQAPAFSALVCSAMGAGP